MIQLETDQLPSDDFGPRKMETLTISPKPSPSSNGMVMVHIQDTKKSSQSPLKVNEIEYSIMNTNPIDMVVSISNIE